MSVRQIIRWVGVCDRCGLAAPVEQDSEGAAELDAGECPCGDSDESYSPTPDVDDP